MLDALRRGSKSWLAKSLLILLVLSFGVWGVADYIVTGGGTPPAIEVGDQEFGQAYVREQFNRDMTRLRRQGMDLTTEQAISFGVLGQTIQTVVQGAVLDETGRSMGLTVTDEGLRAAIQTDPLFQNEQGEFDRDRLTRLLAANQLSESGYIALRRRDMVRAALVDPLNEGAAAPSVVVDALAAHASERRIAEVLTLSNAALPEPAAEPEDAAVLEAVYQDNIATFTAPEYRTSTVLVLSRDAVAKGIEVDPAAIQDYYDARPEEYTTGPTRTVTQALFQSEEKATEALAKVRDEGMSLDEAAKAVGTGGAVEMGAVGETDLPDPLPETIFAQEVGVVGEPVNGPFGWHLFLVTEASEGGATPLDEVRDQIRDVLAQEQALDSLYTLSAEVEDALAGGATIEEAAAQVNLEPMTVTIDNQGRGEDGEAVADLPATPDFLTNLFELDEGELGFMTEYDAGFFIQRLDGVTESAPRPLDEVRDQVLTLWKVEQRAEAAKALADSLFDRAQAGETLAALDFEEPAATLRTTPKVTRAGQTETGASDVENAVVQAMFETEKGALTRVDLPTGVAILRVLDVGQPSAEVAERERAQIAQSLAQSYAQDLSVDYLDALGDSVGVTVNEGVVLGAVSNETQPQ